MQGLRRGRCTVPAGHRCPASTHSSSSSSSSSSSGRRALPLEGSSSWRGKLQQLRSRQRRQRRRLVAGALLGTSCSGCNCCPRVKLGRGRCGSVHLGVLHAPPAWGTHLLRCRGVRWALPVVSLSLRTSRACAAPALPDAPVPASCGPQIWLGRWQETDVVIRQLPPLEGQGSSQEQLQRDDSGGECLLQPLACPGTASPAIAVGVGAEHCMLEWTRLPTGCLHPCCVQPPSQTQQFCRHLTERLGRFG